MGSDEKRGEPSRMRSTDFQWRFPLMYIQEVTSSASVYSGVLTEAAQGPQNGVRTRHAPTWINIILRRKLVVLADPRNRDTLT